MLTIVFTAEVILVTRILVEPPIPLQLAQVTMAVRHLDLL